ncbi:hypothetical protein BGZ73_001722 [Actinomortierella ambigua]|nr:hypothetical protein BGZ73_001722 [Actinomortierella ambigua]
MKTLFKTNFDKFGGSSWKLATGTVFDDRLREKIESLSYESTLHSFIIEDVYTILETFDNAAEKHELKSAMVDLEGKGLPSPTSGELKFLQQYSLPPNELVDFLATRGWRSVAQTLKKKPAEDFQRVAHSCINHVLEAYEENGFAFPQNTSESWFNIHLWGFLRRALSFPGILEYKTGEVASDASSHRRNKQRDLENRQFTGHKVDGMAVIAKRMLEIMYMEASKKDGGINSTKSLHDTRKLLKLVKDAHDDIRMKTFENVRDRVVTYGLRISGPTATVFSLHQRTGRFYQVVKEDVMSFPPIWKDEDDTEVIIAIIARILSLRKAVLAMAMSVTKWTKLPMEKRIAGHHDDWIAPAMTTPQLLPATFDPVEAMPPLALS